MAMTYTYTPKGVCSRRIDLELEGDILKEVTITDGCDGNSQGVAQLAKGRKVEDVVALLSGIRCESRKTSCPDQLAKALLEAVEKMRATETGEDSK
jgi:uncharacterized protein (TIGR03905 family)